MRAFSSLRWSGCSPISVRIDSQTVQMLQIRFGQNRVHGTTTASAAIPDNIEDRDAAVASAIKSCLDRGDFRGRKAILSLCGDNILIQHQRISLDSDEDRNQALNDKIQNELKLSTDFDIDKAHIRCVPVGEIVERHERKEELILVVVDSAVVERYLDIFNGLRLELQRIGVEPFALHKASLRFLPGDWQNEQPVGIVNIGETKVEILIVRKGRIAFVRSLPIGIEKFTESIASRMNIDKDGMSRIVGAMGEGRKVNETVMNAVRSAVRQDMEFLASEILTSLRYFYSNHNREQVGRIVVFGNGAAQLIGRDFLADRLGVPIVFWKWDRPGDGSEGGEGIDLEDEYVALAGLAADEAEGVASEIDFLPSEVVEKRTRKKNNRLRAVYLGATLLLMALFYIKSEQRLAILNNLHEIYQKRSQELDANTKEVERLTALIKTNVKLEKELSTTVCPILATRVLAEVVGVAGTEIRLGKISGDFSYGSRQIVEGKKKKHKTDYEHPIFHLTLEGKATNAAEVSHFVERLKKTGAFSSVRDEGSWDISRSGTDQKQFTIKLAVGEGREL